MTRALLTILALLLLPPLHAAAQVMIQGRVIEAGTRDGVRNATVQIGERQVITSNNGQFQVDRVPRGPATIAISAIGFQTRQFQLEIARDTALLIELELQPVRLDTLRVDARNITVRGVVDAAATDRPIVAADARVPGRDPVSTNLSGRFKLSRIAANVPVTIEVGALGFLPSTVTITASRDTTIRFRLEVDPIGQRMVAEQMQRLDVRAKGQGGPLRIIDQKRLSTLGALSAYDVLRLELGETRLAAIVCAFVDERDSPFWKEELATYFGDELQRVEIIDRTMVRVYTVRGVSSLMRRQQLQPVVIIKGLGRPICR